MSFARALRQVSRVVPAKSSLPILLHMLLDAAPGQVTLTATDTILATVTTLVAEVAVPGRATVPARLLADYAGKLPAEPVRLTLDPARGRVTARCGRSTCRLATLDAAEFPILPPVPDDGLAFDAARLGWALARVRPAAAPDERRPVLASICFGLDAAGLTLAATDGHRLAQVRLPEVIFTGPPRQLLVPVRAAAEFARLLDGDKTGTAVARLAFLPDGRGVRLAVGGSAVSTRLVEGAFPPVARVIPRGWRTRVTVDVATFRRALRLTGIFGEGGARPVLLDAAGERLRLLAKGDESGGEAEVPGTVEGGPGAVVLNTSLLTDLLATPLRTPRLTLSWCGPDTAVTVREAGRPEDADLWLVMPIRDEQLLRQCTMTAATTGTSRAAV